MTWPHRATYEAIDEDGSNMWSLTKGAEDIGLFWEAGMLKPLALGDEAMPPPKISRGEPLLDNLLGGDPLAEAPALGARQVPQRRGRVHEQTRVAGQRKTRPGDGGLLSTQTTPTSHNELVVFLQERRAAFTVQSQSLFGLCHIAHIPKPARTCLTCAWVFRMASGSICEPIGAL